MSKRIFYKLFAVTAIFILLFICIVILLQSLFFERYYIYKKTDKLQQNLTILADKYKDNADRSAQEIQKELEKFSQFFDSRAFYVNIQESNVGTSRSVSTSITGLISGKPESDENIKLFMQEINNWSEIYHKNDKLLDSGKIVSYNIQDSYQNTIVVSICAVTSGNKSTGLIFAFTSLKPVAEATDITRNYYVLILAATLILIIILSLIYSKIISKPLLDINRVASRIAKQDFSEKCNIKSKDELGNLSDTINYLSDNLSRVIRELQISNDKLKVEIEKQKEQENLRREFVAGVSHELKTPLSIIKGYAESIIDGMENGAINKEYVDIILEEEEKMNHLLCDMLDLSQMEASKTEFMIKPFSICRLISYVLKKFLPGMTEKNITTSIDSSREDLMVYADSFRIEQVVKNLLSNALRHTPQGGKISISINEIGDKAQIKIKNTGAKIEKDELNKIWEKFYRVDKSRNKELGGTGLGLSIVSNILKLHNSNFGVENTENGVEFYFTLDVYVDSYFDDEGALPMEENALDK